MRVVSIYIFTNCNVKSPYNLSSGRGWVSCFVFNTFRNVLKGQPWQSIKDRKYGSGFDDDGQFVQQHLRGPDVTLFRGKAGREGGREGRSSINLPRKKS